MVQLSFTFLYNIDHVSSLMVNGSMVSQTAVEPHNWNGTYDITLYLGKYGDNLFSGYIDEVWYIIRIMKVLFVASQSVTC